MDLQNKIEKAYINYEKCLSIILLPVKIFYIPFLFLFSFIFHTSYKLSNNFFLKKLYGYNCDFFLYILGISITKVNRKNYIDDDNSIVVYNHIHILDALVIQSIESQLPRYLILESMNNIFPINIFTYLSDSIIVRKNNKTIEKIKKSLNRNSAKNLYIAPDECQSLKGDELIADFKSGAFVLERDIYPIIIRYVHNSNKFKWQHNTTLIDLIYNLLTMAHIDVYVEYLPKENWNNYKNKEDSYKIYKDSVKFNMEQQLKQYPNELDEVKLIRSIRETLIINAISIYLNCSNLLAYSTIINLIAFINSLVLCYRPKNNIKLFGELINLFIFFSIFI